MHWSLFIVKQFNSSKLFHKKDKIFTFLPWKLHVLYLPHPCWTLVFTQKGMWSCLQVCFWKKKVCNLSGLFFYVKVWTNWSRRPDQWDKKQTLRHLTDVTAVGKVNKTHRPHTFLQCPINTQHIQSKSPSKRPRSWVILLKKKCNKLGFFNDKIQKRSRNLQLFK